LSNTEKILDISRNVQEAVRNDNDKTVNLTKAVTNSKLTTFLVFVNQFLFQNGSVDHEAVGNANYTRIDKDQV
jgi:wobble nucleotide-excising tRNase